MRATIWPQPGNWVCSAWMACASIVSTPSGQFANRCSMVCPLSHDSGGKTCRVYQSLEDFVARGARSDLEAACHSLPAKDFGDFQNSPSLVIKSFVQTQCMQMPRHQVHSSQIQQSLIFFLCAMQLTFTLNIDLINMLLIVCHLINSKSTRHTRQ